MKLIKKMLNKNSELYKYIKTRIAWRNKKKEYFVNPDDKEYAINRYFMKTGDYLDLENPQTFDEKIWWLKLNYRNKLQTIVSDKVSVREYVSSLGLSQILNQVYGVYNDFKEIDFKNLPSEMYIKCNHVSGTNYYWNGKFKKPSLFLKKRFNFMLKQNYYYGSREWNYKNIVPKIICEKVLFTNNSIGLIDYRFFCVNGKVVYIFVDIETADKTGAHSGIARRNIYDTDFNLINIKVSKENFSPGLVSKPDNLKRMIEYAELLAKPFPFVRVDMYNLDGKIVFGEMTFHHAGGVNRFEPPEYQKKFGDMINIEGLIEDSNEV